jgi:hypothetical protein
MAEAFDSDSLPPLWDSTVSFNPDSFSFGISTRKFSGIASARSSSGCYRDFSSLSGIRSLLVDPWPFEPDEVDLFGIARSKM